MGTVWPLSRPDVARLIERKRVDIRRASIREMNNLVNAIEREFDVKFIRMEFGIPGLPTPDIAVRAEADALGRRQVGHVYAPFEGVPELKQEASRFIKLFTDVERSPACCIPTVGAMQGCFAALLLASHMHRDRRTVLCLEPGFPVNRQQLRQLGVPSAHIDFYDHRGDDLVRAVEERASRGDLSAILWSSPNNPTWIVLCESELEGLARVADDHDLVAIEDLAYFGMDTRQDYLVPGQPPFQPTIMRYSDRSISTISSSKIFSYAGQRVGITVLSPGMIERECPDLAATFGTSRVGHAFLHGGLYPIVASVPESPQYGLAAMLRAANEGDRSLFAPAAEYARRAKAMKAVFLQAGFQLVYDNDLGAPLGDGFYFTIRHPSFDHGAELIRELLHYGVSAITLETTGSCRTEGLRACVSLTPPERFGELSERLERFREDQSTAAVSSAREE